MTTTPASDLHPPAVHRRPWRRSPRRLVAAATLTAVALLSACTNASSTDGGGGGASDTLTIGLDLNPPSLDPAQLQSGGSVVPLWQAVFDTLLKWEPDGTISPNAAESYSWNDDKTLLTLKLRKDMTFTDGSLVDAAAVKASLEHMRDGGGSDASRMADTVIETPDDSTVTIQTPEPRGLMTTFLTLAPGALASTASLTSPDVDTTPVGSGPYELDADATTFGDTWTFVRNEDYWNAEAYPYDTVVFRMMEDETARVSALRSGQINAALVTSQAADQVEKAGSTLLTNETVGWTGLIFGDRDGSTVPALGDVRVRQAISMVFDRQAILDNLFQGDGVVSNQIFNPDSEAYDEDLLDTYAYDVDGAKALMAEAGYADGFDLTIPDTAGFDIANPLIVQQLGLLNIRVTPESVPQAEFIPDILGGKYPLFYFALESRSALWDIVQSVTPTSIWNIDHTDDPELDPLLAQAQVAEGDEAREVFQAINQRITDQAWFTAWTTAASIWAFDDSTTAETVLGSAAPYLYTFAPA